MSGSTVAVMASLKQAYFSTAFPSTENPISAGGPWTLGGTAGLDWQNVQTSSGSPGLAFGTGSSSTNDDDNIAILAGQFSTTKHWVHILCHRVGGYSPGVTHEVEALLSFTISGHSAKGYELDFGLGVTIQPVRWNGALNDFDTGVFTTVSGSSFGIVLADGDTIDAVFDSTSGSPVISVWYNNPARSGSATVVWTDTTAGKITSGAPGMGFFYNSGATPTSYAINGFAAGSA